MKLEIIEPIGLCNSASKLLDTINKNIDKYLNIYIVGEILHNEYIINDLSNKGVRFVKDIKNIEMNKYTLVIFPAHGTAPSVYNKMQKYKYLDLTCPKIVNIHIFIQNNSDRDILFMGKKGHSEVVAVKEYKNVKVLYNLEDIDKLGELNNPVLMCQTTFNEKIFNDASIILKEKYPNILIKNTLCNIPLDRIKNINATDCDLLLVIGSKTSSNANEIKNSKPNSMIISQKSDLDINELLKYDKVAIASASSTPIEQVNIIVGAIKNAIK